MSKKSKVARDAAKMARLEIKKTRAKMGTDIGGLAKEAIQHLRPTNQSMQVQAGKAAISSTGGKAIKYASKATKHALTRKAAVEIARSSDDRKARIAEAQYRTEAEKAKYNALGPYAAIISGTASNPMTPGDSGESGNTSVGKFSEIVSAFGG